jgi:hypothetical protein
LALVAGLNTPNHNSVEMGIAEQLGKRLKYGKRQGKGIACRLAVDHRSLWQGYKTMADTRLRSFHERQVVAIAVSGAEFFSAN